jgi:hypothetical protein
VKGLSAKESGLLEGKGKFMRHAKFRSLKEIDEKRIAGLLRMVKKDTGHCHC